LARRRPASAHALRPQYLRHGVFSLAGIPIVVGTIFLVLHVSFKPPHTHASIPPPPSPALKLPDKPSIAVLPFTNTSGDREQEYFSDGITDGLITDLSRLPGATINYPGLERHPNHQRARELFDGFGGMLSFELHGGVDEAEKFISRLRLPISAPSLGGVESLITRPASTSHSGLTPSNTYELELPII
jgi:Cys/Met metabolism PLP-dependent enzyme